MSRVDLDAIKPNGWAPPDTVLAMAAELRAAREVVNQARPYVGLPLPEGMTYPPLAVALAAYDQVAAPKKGTDG